MIRTEVWIYPHLGIPYAIDLLQSLCNEGCHTAAGALGVIFIQDLIKI